VIAAGSLIPTGGVLVALPIVLGVVFLGAIAGELHLIRVALEYIVERAREGDDADN
jgi:hypothetical protein